MTPRNAAIVRRLRPSPYATLRVGLAAAALSGLVACERDSTGTGAQATSPVRVAQPAAQRARVPAVVQSMPLTQRAWWNQSELVDALSLTPEQRTKMDALLQQSMDAQRAAQEQQREQQRKLKESLEAGNWDAARQAAAAAAEGMTTAWRTQTTLKIDVLASLDPDQQRLILSQYRQVLRQTSVLGRLRGDARRRSAAPAAQP